MRGAGVHVERPRVSPLHHEREIMILSENASRHGYHFAQQCLGFSEAPKVIKGVRVVVGCHEGVSIFFASDPPTEEPDFEFDGDGDGFANGAPLPDFGEEGDGGELDELTSADFGEDPYLHVDT